MKKRITKILGVVLSLALLSSLAMVTPVIAQPGENVWAEIDLPPVAPGTDVELLAQAADGTLFASVYDGVEYCLYRSEPDADGVAAWEWDETALFYHEIMVKAYDIHGSTGTDEIGVTIFNFNIIP